VFARTADDDFAVLARRVLHLVVHASNGAAGAAPWALYGFGESHDIGSRLIARKKC
jgi:hypothetical protein